MPVLPGHGRNERYNRSPRPSNQRREQLRRPRQIALYHTDRQHHECRTNKRRRQTPGLQPSRPTGKMKVTAKLPAGKTNRVADRFRRGNRRNITGNNSASGGLLNRPDTLQDTQLEAPDSGQSLINQRTQNHTIQKRGIACSSRARTQRTL